jgi:pimeloyl-ACP methyl ester carboxylesterase
METPFFFEQGAAHLFGLLHVPADTRATTGFVMSHPFAEEKLWSHRVFVSLARKLAKRGFPALRFDYQGAGDSSGLTSETSLDTHLEDLRAAIAALRARCPTVERVGLIGLRLGATFAALVCERAVAGSDDACLREAPLILWDPVIDGEAYFQEILRINLSTQLAVYGKVLETREVLVERVRAGGTVNVDGYEIGAELLATCGVARLMPSSPQHRGPTLVVQVIANDKVKDRNELRTLAESYSTGTFERATEQPFWREIKPFYGRAEHLYNATLSWLERQRV